MRSPNSMRTMRNSEKHFLSFQSIQRVKDPVIRQFRALQTVKGRLAQGKFWVEGEKIVTRAFSYGASVNALFVTDVFVDSEQAGDWFAWIETQVKKITPVYILSTGMMAKLTSSKPTPPCLAVLERKIFPLDEMIRNDSLFLMADQLVNIDNLGMMIRSTEASGANGLILTGDGADPFHQRVARGSCGGVFTVPMCQENSPYSTIQSLREKGVQVVATSATAGIPYTDIDFSAASAIVVGNEQVGLSPAILEAADVTAYIPMSGEIHSLNISVAASIVLYEASRQRSA